MRDWDSSVGQGVPWHEKVLNAGTVGCGCEGKGVEVEVERKSKV